VIVRPGIYLIVGSQDGLLLIDSSGYVENGGYEVRPVLGEADTVRIDDEQLDSFRAVWVGAAPVVEATSGRDYNAVIEAFRAQRDG
jgi:hypothetical protein